VPLDRWTDEYGVAVVVAADNASNSSYIDGWQAGDNGGVGFGPWTFDFSGTGSGLFYPPRFIDKPLTDTTSFFITAALLTV
jgi:hypothetical protein